jgi:hypothetical protein
MTSSPLLLRVFAVLGRKGVGASAETARAGPPMWGQAVRAKTARAGPPCGDKRCLTPLHVRMLGDQPTWIP